jgi:hypothetical protein
MIKDGRWFPDFDAKDIQPVRLLGGLHDKRQSLYP